MIIVVTGSRSINDRAAVDSALVSGITGPVGGYSTVAEVAELWHGGAKGVDTLAAEWAGQNGIKIRPWPVSPEEWAKNPRLAGKRRNHRMMRAAAAEHDRGAHVLVVGIWDWLSGGTAHAIATTAAFGLPVSVQAVRAGAAK